MICESPALRRPERPLVHQIKSLALSIFRLIANTDWKVKAAVHGAIQSTSGIKRALLSHPRSRREVFSLVIRKTKILTPSYQRILRRDYMQKLSTTLPDTVVKVPPQTTPRFSSLATLLRLKMAKRRGLKVEIAIQLSYSLQRIPSLDWRKCNPHRIYHRIWTYPHILQERVLTI